MDDRRGNRTKCACAEQAATAADGRFAVADARTVVFTTHDPNAAAATAPYGVLLREERVAAAGEMSQILRPQFLQATHGVGVGVADVNGRPVVFSNLAQPL